MKLQDFFVHDKIKELKQQIHSMQESIISSSANHDGVLNFTYFKTLKQKANLERDLERMENIITTPDDDHPKLA